MSAHSTDNERSWQGIFFYSVGIVHYIFNLRDNAHYNKKENKNDTCIK